MGSFYREGTIGAILCKSQIISEKDIETALEEQKRTGLRFGETLVNLGIVMQEDIDWALSHQLDIPYVRINENNVDPAAIKLVPSSIARKNMLLPLIKTEDELRIAIADPLNKEAVTEVEQVSGCTVSISMGLLREIREMQDHFYGTAEDMNVMGFSSQFFPQAVVESINSDSTGANLLDNLLAYIANKNLSSLSIKPMKDKVTVTGRQGRGFSAVGTFSLLHYGRLLATLKKKAGTIIRDDISTRASLSVDVNGERSLFQVIMTQAGEWDYVTLKPLVSSFFPESIADLETSEQNRQMLLKIAGAPEGMVFFSSTDEDERTRLMGVCLMECNGLGRESMVIGEGLRFLGDGMSVLPVRRGDENMGVWIRAACEHEPDIVAVEDLPLDASVLTAAYNCTLRGKLLFGGVHAPGVRATLRKLCCLRERFPMFLTNLRGIAACRSVRILCTACTGKGCTACNNTGYSGKRYLVETVLFDDEMLEVLRRSAAGAEVMDFLAERGFRGIHDVAADMLRAGEITEDEYNMATIDNGRLIWP